MTFKFAVRDVVDKHMKYWELVDVHSELKVICDREEDSKIKKKLTKAMELVDKSCSHKRKVYNNAVDELEKEFIQDVLSNKDFYELKIKNDNKVEE